MIAQVIIAAVDEVRSIEADLRSEMEQFTLQQGLDLFVVAFTSIVENGSIFYASGRLQEIVTEVFPNENGEHSFQEDILSRKIRSSRCCHGRSSMHRSESIQFIRTVPVTETVLFTNAFIGKTGDRLFQIGRSDTRIFILFDHLPNLYLSPSRKKTKSRKRFLLFFPAFSVL